MKYQEIKDRTLTNLGIEEADSRRLKIINQDIADTIADVFVKSESPRKHICYNINRLKGTVEDFEDAVLIPNSEIIDLGEIGGDINGGALRFSEADGGFLIQDIDTGIKIVNFQVVIQHLFVGIPLGGTVDITLQILSESGEELLEKTYTVVEGVDQGLLDKNGQPVLNKDGDPINVVGTGVGELNVSESIAIDGCKLQIKWLQRNATPGYEVALYSIGWDFDNESIELPSDCFVPLEAKWEASVGGRRYASASMTAEEFMLWNPNRLTTVLNAENLDEDIQNDIDGVNATLYSTEENIRYDGMIGYYYEVLEEGKTILHFKQKFQGVLTLYYSYFPDIQVVDNQTIMFHRIFSDILVFGATIRGLRRRQKSATSEVEFAGIRAELADYKGEYDRVTKEWTALTNSKSMEVHNIQPLGFLNDTTMELLR